MSASSPNLESLRESVGREPLVRPRMRSFIAAALLCVLVINAGILVIGWPQFVHNRIGDFPVFYYTSRMARGGALHRLYDPAAQDQFANRPSPAPGLYFYHPPYEVLLLWPLSLLSYRAAFLCW